MNRTAVENSEVAEPGAGIGARARARTRGADPGPGAGLAALPARADPT